MDLGKLLKPKSVALIGASDRLSFGGDACRIILQYKRDLSRVYFINPNRGEVYGHKCYRSITEIDDEVELVIISTPKKSVNGLLREAAAKGCRAAVIHASGYSETGEEGRRDQEELVALCNELDIALMGPNCVGFGNFVDGVFAFAFRANHSGRCGNIALVSQSGQFCMSGLDMPGMNFSYLISSGNSAQISMEEYISYLVDDEDTKVICAYIEGIRKPEIFVDALRRAAIKRKPVVVLKGGRSEKAAELAASHTGSLAGSDKTLGAIFEKYGVIRVDDIQELYSTAQMFSRLKRLPEPLKYTSLSISGGEALITADAAQGFDIEWAEFGPETKRRLQELVPDYATVNNPLDLTATLALDPVKCDQVLEIVMADEDVGAVLSASTITHNLSEGGILVFQAGLERAVSDADAKPVLMLNFVHHTHPPAMTDWLEEKNIPVLPTAHLGMKMLASLNSFATYRPEGRNFRFVRSDAAPDAPSAALTEYESLAELQRAGIAPSKCTVVPEVSALAAALETFSFPVAMKIDSPDILHKTEAGGVRLNVGSLAEAEAAFAEIMAKARSFKPDAKLGGVMIREMLPKGTEVIVGVTVDAQFGPFVMVGLGGVFVELFEDVSLCPAPLTKHEALGMIKSLRAFKLLQGYRGEAARDIDALADFIVRVGDYACENIGTLREMDINPLFVYEDGQGVAPADALIVRNG